MPSSVNYKIILLALAAVFIISAFWLSHQSPSIGAPEIVEARSDELLADLHSLDKLLIRYPREGRALQGFYRPTAEVKLEGFEIDSCEVSQSDYGRFLQWHQRSKPKNLPSDWRDNRWQPLGIDSDADWLSRTRDHKFLGRNEVPVTGILPAAAQAYCRQMGGNLPTEFQWEVAAAGSAGRLFPWGNEPPKTDRLFHDPILNIARACGAEGSPRTPEGLEDMGSGVSNLTLLPQGFPFESKPSRPESPYVLKGGGWRQPDAIYALNFLRAPAGEDLVSNYVGFRCAYPSHRRWTGNHAGRVLRSPWNSRPKTVHFPSGVYAIGQPQGSVLLELSTAINVSQYLGLIDQATQAKESSSIRFVTRSEIKVAQYQRFLQNFIARLGFYDHPVQPEHHQHTPLRWESQLQNPDKPVRGVNWWSAMAYAKWLGGSLLSEQEWMLFAGGLNREYPDLDNAGTGVLRDPRYMQQLRAAFDGSNDLNSSGLVALGGNVMEWTRTIIPGSSLNFVLKGGSYRTPRQAAKVASTSFAPPEYRSMDLGFRVIFDEKPSWLSADAVVQPSQPNGTEAN